MDGFEKKEEMTETVAEAVAEEVVEAVAPAEAVVEEAVETETVEQSAAANVYTAPVYEAKNEYGTYNSNAANYNTYANYENYAPTQSGGGDGFCITALVLGIVGFFVNPVYVCSILAIIFGLIGQSKKGPKAKLAMIGWILGICSIGAQVLLDLLLTFFTAGFGGVSFCC